MPDKTPKFALLGYIARAARETTILKESRLHEVAEALRAVGVEPDPAI